MITEEQFKDLALSRLPEDIHERALRLFKDCPKISWDITNVLMHAGDQSKGEEVLKMLEEHYEKHLQFQHPDIRGTVTGAFGNETEALLINICESTLGLKPQ